MRPPRSCYEELDGLVLLPRTIDKFRASLPGGTLNGYFPASGPILGLSAYWLQRLGITEDAFRAAVASAADDTEVAAWVRARTDASQYPAINATLRKITRRHVEDATIFEEIYRETLAQRPDLELVMEIIEADDRRMYGTPA